MIANVGGCCFGRCASFCSSRVCTGRQQLHIKSYHENDHNTDVSEYDFTEKDERLMIDSTPMFQHNIEAAAGASRMDGSAQIKTKEIKTQRNGAAGGRNKRKTGEIKHRQNTKKETVDKQLNPIGALRCRGEEDNRQSMVGNENI